MDLELRRLIRLAARKAFRAADGSFEAFQADELVGSAIQLAHRARTGAQRDRDGSEREYSRVAGYSIRTLHHQDRERFAVVDGQVRTIGSRELHRVLYRERNRLLEEVPFRSILEVGAGEFTTLYSVYEHFGAAKTYCGFDISLNRVLHGRRFAAERGMSVTAFQADATQIPFPDDSFDLVMTSHALEQMPRIFPQAVGEILRVAARSAVLFEPSFELGSTLQKVRMYAMDYLRGLPRYLQSRTDVRLHPVRLTETAASPVNRTAMFRIDKVPRSSDARALGPVDFVCPISKGPLRRVSGGFYSPDAGLFFPEIMDVPVLYARYAQAVSPEMVDGAAIPRPVERTPQA